MFFYLVSIFCEFFLCLHLLLSVMELEVLSFSTNLLIVDTSSSGIRAPCVLSSESSSHLQHHLHLQHPVTIQLQDLPHPRDQHQQFMFFSSRSSVFFFFSSSFLRSANHGYETGLDGFYVALNKSSLVTTI